MESTRRFRPEDIDLAALTHTIRRAFDAPIEGTVVGRTRLRDAVAGQLRCSQLQAEQLVDTLIGRGLLTLEKTRDGAAVWRFPEEA